MDIHKSENYQIKLVNPFFEVDLVLYFRMLDCPFSEKIFFLMPLFSSLPSFIIRLWCIVKIPCGLGFFPSCSLNMNYLFS